MSTLRADEPENRQHQRRQRAADDNDDRRAVATDHRQAETLHLRRPEELQRPGQHRQIDEADLVEREALRPQDRRQAEHRQPADHALRDIEPTDREEDRGRRRPWLDCLFRRHQKR
jgi:hypothetical protein